MLLTFLFETYDHTVAMRLVFVRPWLGEYVQDQLFSDLRRYLITRPSLIHVWTTETRENTTPRTRDILLSSWVTWNFISRLSVETKTSKRRGRINTSLQFLWMYEGRVGWSYLKSRRPGAESKCYQLQSSFWLHKSDRPVALWRVGTTTTYKKGAKSNPLDTHHTDNKEIGEVIKNAIFVDQRRADIC